MRSLGLRLFMITFKCIESNRQAPGIVRAGLLLALLLAAQTFARPVALVGDRVIDGVSGEPHTNSVVIVDEERIVAIVHVGEPAQVPDAKPRIDARELTTWLD